MLAQDSDEELATPPLVTTTRHTGADFEDGRVGRPRGDVMPGVPIIDARLPEDDRSCGSRQTSLGFVPAPFPPVPAAASPTAAVGEGKGRSTRTNVSCGMAAYWDGEAALSIPEGYRVVAMPPSEAELDSRLSLFPSLYKLHTTRRPQPATAARPRVGVTD